MLLTMHPLPGTRTRCALQTSVVSVQASWRVGSAATWHQFAVYAALLHPWRAATLAMFCWPQTHGALQLLCALLLPPADLPAKPLERWDLNGSTRQMRCHHTHWELYVQVAAENAFTLMFRSTIKLQQKHSTVPCHQLYYKRHIKQRR